MADDGTAPRRANAKARILEWLEVLAKLLGASAVLVVALFANSLQSRLTGVSIQSQREQAESQLRASMFNSLISPIAGPLGGEKPMPADREMILTELLALNFNENFEMKPLMEDAIKRLITEKPVSPKRGRIPANRSGRLRAGSLNGRKRRSHGNGPPAKPPNHQEFFRWDHSCFRGNLPPIPPTDARFIT